LIGDGGFGVGGSDVLSLCIEEVELNMDWVKVRFAEMGSWRDIKEL
jgi:hypothetical protein